MSVKPEYRKEKNCNPIFGKSDMSPGADSIESVKLEYRKEKIAIQFLGRVT